MPWSTPTLRDVRALVRDNIRGSLPGADASVPNSVLRVLSDNQGALCHLVLQYIDWLALQLLPDTAETEWLDRHGDIWLTNADATTGRKVATLAQGTVTFTGTGGVVIPAGTRLQYAGGGATAQQYETTAFVVLDADAPTPGPVRALDPGSAGNALPGAGMAFVIPVAGADTDVVIVTMTGGTDEETDDDLRSRVLQRIRQPPQGGADHDYVRWALAVPGCTRAWVSPLEMGIGTVTVRVLFDDLRADDDGWPRQQDLDAATAYIDSVRPVAVKDFWVLAPIKQFIDVKIGDLVPDTTEVRGAIEASLQEMLFEKAKPGQTIFAAWKAQAIMNTANVVSFDLMDWDDDVMPSPGHMAVLGDIVYVV
jgi:uncharacterized phage protein gp47/JayE